MQSAIDTFVVIAVHRAGDEARDQRRIGALVVALAFVWGGLSLLLAAADPIGAWMVGVAVLFFHVPLASLGLVAWLQGVKHLTSHPNLRLELTRHHLRIGGRRIPLENIQDVQSHSVPPWFELQLPDERVRLPDGYELDGTEARAFSEALVSRTSVLAEAEDRPDARARLQALAR